MHTLRMLVERDQDYWIARCVEQDLTTQADALEELIFEIELMLISHIASCRERSIEPFSLAAPPTEVLRAFERATMVLAPRGTMEGLPRLEIRIDA